MTKKIRLALFMAIRNNTVMPIGLRQGKSMDEINKMSYATMEELLNGDTIDWQRAELSYLQGQRLYINDVDRKDYAVEMEIE